MELAQAYGHPLSLSQIAQAEDLSPAYLEQLIASLRRAGLVFSIRGAKGGYRLSAPPSQISVGMVLRALEGPLAPAECASETKTSAHCRREEACPSRLVWQKVRDSLAEVIDSTTLADLCLPQHKTPGESTFALMSNMREHSSPSDCTSHPRREK